MSERLRLSLRRDASTISLVAPAFFSVKKPARNILGPLRIGR